MAIITKAETDALNTERGAASDPYHRGGSPRNADKAMGLFTLATLAAFLGISKNHVRRLWQRGDLPAPFYASERRPLWRRETIDAFIAEREAARDGQAMKVTTE